MRKRVMVVGVVVVSLLASSALLLAADLNDVVGVLPKFAIPMREVGDRLQEVVKQKAPSDVGIDYQVSSKAEDVPK